jgi:hypothetical protein
MAGGSPLASTRLPHALKRCLLPTQSTLPRKDNPSGESRSRRQISFDSSCGRSAFLRFAFQGPKKMHFNPTFGGYIAM